ncbi:hypothetical protein DICSQDRAFT_60547 [Dichomitus squalens LYAD-421 SS1]|uniref:Uncharacterized protein n=1 Tax=Dichomitus squalens (strain LYAD-421) TaxID=732165 RepID=R7SZI9_DICSQ|nr:uncharacterized protein DICSQDRAFT_60547 [Dichomitus squalens LYAD-421 SS1]EJF61368.1 hypothetical protein DICSQDRAFT_60547 [Dichomitus squalens LYAD-421 SS1]
MAFVQALKSATLEDSGLDPKVIERMRNPAHDEDLPDLTAPENRALRLALKQFIATGHSEKIYRDCRDNIMEFNEGLTLPTYEAMQKIVQELSGVVPIVTDMCPDTCVAYTGPFAELDRCPECGAAWYEMRGRKRVARRTFQTHPLGPQVQALYRSRHCAERMHHREKVVERLMEMANAHKMVEVTEDVFYAEEYIKLVEAGTIREDDLVLMFSLDGVQLYEFKQSDCWIYIWILFDLAPEVRYKKRYVLPGAFIPGPKKPKNVDSFLFPGLYHVAALQNSPLQISSRMMHSRPIILFATGDTPAMAYINGLVGHSGQHGCRLFCPLKGRRKPGGGGHYYPAMLKPADPEYERVRGSVHPNYILRNPPPSDESSSDRYWRQLGEVLACQTQAQYVKKRLETGIAKPSLFMGLPVLCRFPNSFPADIMHLLTLNVTDLVLGLLRGTLKRSTLTDPVEDWDWACFADAETWEAHGKLVAEASLYLPGSFDRPPRNPAEKISSGYKAWEYMYYVYGYLPAVQKPKYYWHFCKLVAGARVALLLGTPVKLRQPVHTLLVEYVEDFEEMYYGRRVDRLHFCRQALHGLMHLMPENARVGPAWLHSQWPLENAIGNLTAEIGSHSKPYENLSNRGLRRAQVSALIAMFPQTLEVVPALPARAVELGDNYVLLHPTMRSPREIGLADSRALAAYLAAQVVKVPEGWTPRLIKWGRLRLPNGEVARTAWKECEGKRRGRPVHRARMVKVYSSIVEVQYFFRLQRMREDSGTDEADLNLAMVSYFTPLDPAIVRDSYGALLACRYQGDVSREVIDIKRIKALVAMLPLPPRCEEAEDPCAAELYTNRFFVVERLGFDSSLIGHEEDPAREQDLDNDE